MTTTITVPDDLHLGSGSHKTAGDGYCFVEAWTHLRGLPFSDRPDCMSPTIAAFLRAWNDGLPDDQRDEHLVRYLTVEFPKGTDEVEHRRSLLALDWLVRTHLPAWLDLTPSLVPHAEALRALSQVTDATAAETGKVVRAAGDAAAVAAAVAAWDAAAVAAGAAAAAAARAAAAVAAGDAARDAARDAGDAARAAAGDAARVAAAAAAAAAAGAAAGDAARDAARDALAPTVTQLQQSAHELLARMAEVQT